MRLHGKEMLQHSARVLFSTLREREKAVDCEKTCSAVLPWPVSWEATCDNERAAHRLREKLGLPTDQRLALFCGRLHPIKRPLETIQAFLNSASSEWTLIVVGDSSAELSIEQVRKAAGGTGSRVRVVGPVYGESLRDFYRAAELVLLLSQRENFGYVLAEALSHGTPVVVTDEVDLSPHILEERCGFVLPNFCASGPWQELESIFRIDRSVLKDLGRHGRDWTRREFSRDRFNYKLVELSKSIVMSSQPQELVS
jgi:glycosyltransferase involved in cell wall biosynthesis